jgi:hypothetical protein
MKTFRTITTPWVRLLLPAVTLFAGSPRLSADVRDEKPVTMEKVVVGATKTHTLFMGADIAINLDRDVYAVRDVVGSAWVVDIGGKEKVVSAKQAPLNLKITPTLKLTETSATIVGLRKLRAYSFANDPNVLLTKGLNQSASINSDLLAVARNAQARVDVASSKAYGGASVFVGADDQFSANAMETTAQFAYSNTHTKGINGGGLPIASTVVGGPNATGTLGLTVDIAANSAKLAAGQTENGDEPGDKLATAGYDAMDIEFDISSEKPLHNPYVVTMTRFRGKDSRPGMVQNMVYAKSLDPIYKQISHVHFSEEGFPFDYEVIDFQLHIYDKGVEIATNVAKNRVELTRDEAFEYIKMEYEGAHQKETLPAVPAMGQLPADLPNQIAQGKYTETYYVKVTKEGMGVGTFLDAACTRKAEDPYINAVVARIRFKPALASGKPVEGVAALKLGQLTI